MKVLLEFGRSRSSSWPWVMRLCRRHPTYCVRQDEGVEVHSLLFNERTLRPALTILESKRGWRDVAVTINGDTMGHNAAWSRIYGMLKPELEVDASLELPTADLNRRLEGTGLRVDFTRQARRGA